MSQETRFPKVTAATTLSLGALLLMRFIGADSWIRIEAPTAPLMSFTPFIAITAAIHALISRRKSAAVVASSFGALMISRVRGHSQPAATGPVLNVMTANLLYGRGSAVEVVELARRLNVDVLFTQELTKSAATRLQCAGLHDLMPYNCLGIRGQSSRGSGIYSRHPLTSGAILQQVTAAQPTASITLPAGQVLDLICAHPRPPAPILSRRHVTIWRNELAVLPPPRSDAVRIIGGDFNASVDHAAFRRVLKLGYVDAAIQTGNGLRRTWGRENKPPLLTIDHILVDKRCAVLKTSVHSIPSSDHRTVYAQFRIPADITQL